MTKLIVEIDDVKDVHLFRIFAERLGFNVTQEKNSSPRKDLTYHKSIIAKGIQRPLSHLEERLTYLQADRQDRILPNR